MKNLATCIAIAMPALTAAGCEAPGASAVPRKPSAPIISAKIVDGECKVKESTILRSKRAAWVRIEVQISGSLNSTVHIEVGDEDILFPRQGIDDYLRRRPQRDEVMLLTPNRVGLPRDWRCTAEYHLSPWAKSDSVDLEVFWVDYLLGEESRKPVWTTTLYPTWEATKPD